MVQQAAAPMLLQLLALGRLQEAGEGGDVVEVDDLAAEEEREEAQQQFEQSREDCLDGRYGAAAWGGGSGSGG